ncbi:hypothetical protein NKH69_30260 [Mesorhizobium sp. M0976]|uniref:hypothetical protein n=1 Tax=Mesorhizobium sp. M0976 TaxID=2957038 RepID=UPI0033362AEC
MSDSNHAWQCSVPSAAKLMAQNTGYVPDHAALLDFCLIAMVAAPTECRSAAQRRNQ